MQESTEATLESSANEDGKAELTGGSTIKDDETAQDEAKAANPPEPSPPIVLSTRALDSMWNSGTLSDADSSALPPPRHFDDTLSELRITLFPKTQHKAVHVVDGAPLVEPTLALYCPIEGGEYVIDATVKELAQRTGAEVQVVDMAHVAAGEWGNFGRLASEFRFKNNPLGKVRPNEEASDEDDGDKNLKALESFWRALIESDPPAPALNGQEPSSPKSTSIEGPSSAGTASPAKRPRIVYIRDFALLAPRSNSWFPPLYSAIRARRTSGAGPDKPISSPTTIIFGVCPVISSILPNAASGGGCQCSSCRPSPKRWDESATQDRADRLKGLKEKWNSGTLLGDLPSFTRTVKIPKDKKEVDSKDQGDSKDQETTNDSEPSDNPTYEQQLNGYFSSCIVAPAKRDPKLERVARERRRRELNELMFRMMLGVKGGEIENGAAPVGEEGGGLTKGWDESLLELDTFKDVVDRALKMARLSGQEEGEQDRILVAWAQLEDAWRAKNLSDEERKAWTSADDSGGKPDDQENDKEKEAEKEKEEEKLQVDEVIEKVKSADLDDHEQRLLGCIVDVVKIPTTFDNVHLPLEVIDSVRSVVSLPLLFPDAFKSGILKQQAISGALLFGPPGTGKTLVVRALAKESGARMWIGETEKLVKSLFKLASRLKPCVVFIDEIDSLMGCRQSKAGDGGARWHTSMLTEFMQEMDGLMASSVMVIGATNRPFDIDDAVLRRLPCRLLIDLPGERAREEILKIMLRDDELGPDVDLGDLAKKTDRFSGSDLKHLCVAAAMDALKESVKLPWATKKEESKDIPSTNKTPAASVPEPEPVANATTKPENDRAKSASSDESDDTSFYSSSNPASDSQSTAPTTPDEEPPKTEPEPEKAKPRILEARHFLRALRDITPSASESRGSLTELRKWNAQFGTGVQDRPQRPTSSLPYSYGGGKATGLGGVPGVNGLSGIGSSGLGAPGPGPSGLGSSPDASRLNSFLSGAGYPTPASLSYGVTGAGYTPSPLGTGYTPKFPASTRNVPGYNPSTPSETPPGPGL
ncbi:hypothetical protein FRC08_000157 [Ceratobasidium sp. 394]|nr:hypothetical protein FRC08_000157 [Ceratobasidium sp. 394]